MTIGPLEFRDPWLLLLAVPALAAVWWSFRRRRRVPALVFPSVARVRGLRPTWRQRARRLVPVLHGLAVLGLVTAAARPREGDVRTRVRNEGIAIQMVLDRSSSMEQELRYRGRTERKIDIVKDVFRRFIVGEGEELSGREGDVIGLTTFARYTEESCPLVAEPEPLLQVVEELTTVPAAVDAYRRPLSLREVRQREERGDVRGLERSPLDGTAIGDGIESGVLSLIKGEEDLERGGYEVKSKVLILLTDGKDNASRTSPVEAGRLAESNGIRLYYVLLKDDQKRVNFFGRSRVVGEIPPDVLLETPREVAGSPDRAFLATDGDALTEIYEEIDAMERSEVSATEYRSYNERYHLFLLPGAACLLLAFVLGETVFRRFP